MWPGDWKEQLRHLNLKIARNNANGAAKPNYKSANLVSEQEWWVFVGILISAGPHGKGGVKLWERSKESFGMTQSINYGPKPDGLGIMAEYRFKEIKAAFPWSFQDKTKAPPDDGSEDDAKDPWHMVLLLVNGFNKNRQEWVAASVRKVLDESMSAFRPRTSKTGGFPNISYILRKPEPLGTEFKVIACAVTSELLLQKAPSCTCFGVVRCGVLFALMIRPC
jgi:hypothetical protein